MCTDTNYSIQQRGEESGNGWKENFVDHDRASRTRSVGEAVSQSFSYITIYNFAASDECDILHESALLAQREVLEDSSRTHVIGASNAAHYNCIRFSVEAILDSNAKSVSSVFLNRILGFLEGTERWGRIDAMSNLAVEIFGTSCDLTTMTVNWYAEPDSNGKLHPEPKVNIYGPGGYFKQHEDGMQLTLLVILNDDYDGGGTAFYSEKEEAKDDNLIPTSTARPPKGNALIWSANLLHMALPVKSGTRVVFVGSFSLDGIFQTVGSSR